MSNTRIYCILFLIFSTTLAQVFAQRAAFKPQVHEISLQLGAVNAIPAFGDNYDSSLPMSIHPLNGIMYTYHYSISDGFRAGVFRRKADLVFPDGFDRFENYQASKTDWDIHLGYKRMYHMGQSQIYAGADLIYSRGKIDAMAEATNGDMFPDAYTYQNYGMSAFMGYSFFFSPYLSLSLEGEGYYTGFQQRQASGSTEPLNIFIQEDGEFGLNASVRLNFHFVKMSKRCTCPKGH